MGLVWFVIRWELGLKFCLKEKKWVCELNILRALVYEGLVKVSGFIKAEVAPSWTIRFTLYLVIILINNVVSYLPDRIYYRKLSFIFLLSYLKSWLADYSTNVYQSFERKLLTPLFHRLYVFGPLTTITNQ